MFDFSLCRASRCFHFWFETFSLCNGTFFQNNNELVINIMRLSFFYCIFIKLYFFLHKCILWFIIYYKNIDLYSFLHYFIRLKIPIVGDINVYTTLRTYIYLDYLQIYLDVIIFLQLLFQIQYMTRHILSTIYLEVYNTIKFTIW